jgi:hypothetical protein
MAIETLNNGFVHTADRDAFAAGPINEMFCCADKFARGVRCVPDIAVPEQSCRTLLPMGCLEALECAPLS